MYRGLKQVITKMLRHRVTLKKVSKAEGEDAWGTPSTVVKKEYTVRASLAPIRLEDLAFLPPGVLKEGDLRIFFLPSYKVDGETVVPEAMDLVSYNGVDYEIRSITEISDGVQVYLKEALARRL
jgi:hypothetical protein